MQIVCTVEGGEAVSYDERCIAMALGEEKYFSLPQDEAFSFRITGYDSGTVSITLSETDSAEIKTQTRYVDLPVQTADVFTFTEDAGIKESSAGLRITKNVAETIEPDSFVVSNSPDPVIRIHNYAASRTIDYRTTITFSADEIQNPVPDAQIYWFINGQHKGTGNAYTEYDTRNDFTVQAKYLKDGIVLAESETETVKVNTGFFARLKAFFRALFGRLPNVVQEYCGAEILDKMLP